VGQHPIVRARHGSGAPARRIAASLDAIAEHFLHRTNVSLPPVADLRLHEPGAHPRVRALLVLPPLGPRHHHVNVAATAPGADEPLSPLGNGGLGPVLLGQLGGIGLDLVTARLAPHDQPHASRGGIAERHRWPGLRSHPRCRCP